MLFELFVVFIALAVIFFIAAFYFENYPTFIVSGIFFLMLTIGVFATGLDVRAGEIMTEEILCPGYINESCVQGVAYNMTTTTEYTYANYEGIGSRTLGAFLLGLSFFAFGCALIYATPKEDREYDPKNKEWNYY